MASYVLITGALGGIGTRMAHELARRGYSLWLVDQRPDEQAFAAEIQRTYTVDTRFTALDVTSAPAREDFLQAQAAAGTRFCGLIHIAGRDFEGAFLEKSRDQILYLSRLIIEANLDLTHGILSLRDPNRRFLLISISSLAGFFPMPYKATYAAAKRFLLDFSRAMHEEIGEFADVLAVCPAGLPTTAESRRKIAAQGFWGRVTTVDTDRVVRRAVELALRGRAVYVPGVLSQIFAALGGLLPPAWVALWVGRRWRSAQQKVRAMQQAQDGQET